MRGPLLSENDRTYRELEAWADEGLIGRFDARSNSDVVLSELLEVIRLHLMEAKRGTAQA